MKMKKRIKQGAGVALALMLAVPAVMYTAQAAVGIDTDRDCSVSFQLDGTFQELDTLEIPVNLYQVAQVDEKGDYESLAGFEILDLENVDNETTAREWEEKAAQAAQVIEEGNIAPTQRTTAEEGAENLSPGMYLVDAQQVQSPEYTYSFTPYLLSLPDNYYSDTNPDDSWIYDVTVGLKPEQEIRYGSVRINKTLDAYNATLGGASFIFSIEAVKDGETVYSDVVSLVFNGPGTKSIEVGNIPAGAQVTVTEVYSGSSYQVVGDNVATTVISAEDPAEVSFVNTYDDENNGGSSIVNHFDYTAPEENDSEDGSQAAENQTGGTWTWTQQTDSTDVQE